MAGETHAALPRSHTKLLIIFCTAKSHLSQLPVCCVPLLLRFHPDIAQKRVHTRPMIHPKHNKSKPEDAAKNNTVQSGEECWIDGYSHFLPK
jgi:hypothetical protein